MPWNETCPMDERKKFIRGYLHSDTPVTQLCAQAGISCRVGYKWIHRFEQEGLSGLKERSRARHTQARRTPPDKVERIIEARLRYRWGPRKLRHRLMERWPDEHWPAASTIGTILKREGLVKSKPKRRPQAVPTPRPLIEPQAPNELWTIDFKGQFRLGNRRYCFPLTLVDDFSRFVLRCDGVYQTSHQQVQPSLVQAFRHYGLPHYIRSDNGPPFATTGIAGLSRLGVWWTRLGIRQERIRPGCPQENARHERMHRSLKQEAIYTIQANLRQQQKVFDRWRSDFNEVRTHEALDDRKPAQVYTTSERQYQELCAPLSYPPNYLIRAVRPNGTIYWHSDELFVSKSLAGEDLGLQQIDEHRWHVHFADLKIGMMDTELMKVLPMCPV